LVREIRIGSRESALAVAQTRLIMEPIARAHPELSLRLVTMKTQGDLRPEQPLEGSGGKDLFTGALAHALARGEVDLCVHSLKDMAQNIPETVPIVGFAKRGDPRDMLILPEGRGFEGFDKIRETGGGGAAIGCSSLRRRIQLRALEPRLSFAPIRGNVPTRLSKMDQGQYGALVLALAGLTRLGISRAGYVFPVREMIPAAGQGTLALQGRRGEDYRFLDAVRDPVTGEEAVAERAFIRAIGGGCDSPAAAFARIDGQEIALIAMYAANEQSPLYKDEISGRREDGPRLAETLAGRLLKKAEG
jgi:hydroxymethylbilane synthase